MQSLVVRRLASAGLMLVAVALVACGGGGGGGDAVDDGPRLPQATLVRDDNPTAPRLAEGPADYLPVGVSVQSVFDRLDANGTRLGASTLGLTTVGNILRAVESEDGGAAQTSDLRMDANGWKLPDLSGAGLPAGALAIIGELTQYAQPFHAIGSTRVQWRSGNLGADLDGDGVNESFELEFRQTMVGYERVAGPNGVIDALHIRDDILITVIPSTRSSPSARVSTASDVWLAKGLGFVREQVRATGPDGAQLFVPYTLALVSVRIDGADPLDASAINQVQALDLANRDLVYDAPRGRYYASVPGSVLGQGNRIAIIDAASGALSYSAVVGSEPGAMALAADGASLYVALDGSSELLRLALPGLTEIGRTRLPADSSFGPYVTESLAASPVAPGVVALSLAYSGLSPRHAGVLLVRDMLAQPQRTQGHTGSNAMVFGADGQWLYGINNETTEFGLRRIELLADGLAERQVVADAVSQFYVRSIDRTANGLVVGNRLFAEGTLAPLGQISGGVDCRALPARRLACLTSNFDAAFELLLGNADDATVLARLHAPADSQSYRRMLVAGPAGQLAVRDRIDHPAHNLAARILLLRHPAL